jgi:hypothetical protein
MVGFEHEHSDPKCADPRTPAAASLHNAAALRARSSRIPVPVPSRDSRDGIGGGGSGSDKGRDERTD